MSKQKDFSRIKQEILCGIGIPLELYRIVEKHILNSKVSHSENKAFAASLVLANSKHLGLEYHPEWLPISKKEYLEKKKAEESLEYLSYDAICDLYDRYKILEATKAFKKEIVMNFTKDEVHDMLNWLY